MRVQNQLFSDWQNLILFTHTKKIRRKNFPVAVSGGRRGFPASDGNGGRWWWSAVVNGGGSNGQWCKVVVVVNGERIRKIKNNCSNKGCQGKWLQQWRLKKLRKQSLLDQELWYQVERNRWNIFLRYLSNVITVSIYRLFYNLIKERNNRQWKPEIMSV